MHQNWGAEDAEAEEWRMRRGIPLPSRLDGLWASEERRWLLQLQRGSRLRADAVADAVLHNWMPQNASDATETYALSAVP